VDAYKSIKASKMLVESDRLLVCQFKCDDHRGRAQFEAVVKLLSILGGTIYSEVGTKVEDGIEYVNAFFNESSWELCGEVLDKVYGTNFLKDKSKLHEKPGLQNDPPLLIESLLGHQVKLDYHRQILNSYLTLGRPEEVNEEPWQKLTFQVLADIAQRLPEYKPSISFIIKMLFGMDIDP
jgi:hypothetical protein